MKTLKDLFVSSHIKVGDEVRCTSDLIPGVHKVWDVGSKIILLEGMEDKILPKTVFEINYDLSIPMNFSSQVLPEYFSYIRVGGLNIHKYIDKIEGGIIKSTSNASSKIKNMIEGLSIFETECNVKTNNIKKKDKVFFNFEAIRLHISKDTLDQGMDATLNLHRVGASLPEPVKLRVLSHNKHFISGVVSQIVNEEFETKYIIKVTCSKGNNYYLNMYPGYLYPMESYIPKKSIQIGDKVITKSNKTGEVVHIIKTSSKPYYVIKFEGEDKTETLNKSQLKIVNNYEKMEQENCEIVL